ncbi:TPA: hypothetical protein LA827_001633 [Clostridium botulinum]|nr:hypothetical protein [Clostridium botulinum]
MDEYRKHGKFNGLNTKIEKYNVALKNSMKSAGFSEGDSDLIIEIARHQQGVYGLSEASEVPRVPGKIYFKDNGGN